MHTEITAIEEIKGTEKEGLTLNRVRVEETRVDREQTRGTDYPSGIIVCD
jgi:hypothetical protein